MKKISFSKLRVIITLLSCIFLFNSQAQYIHTSNNKILNGNNNIVQLAGVNLGNWLLFEGYMNQENNFNKTHSQIIDGFTKAFGNDANKAASFVDYWRSNYVNNRTIEELKSMGFNCVRVPFHYNMFWKNNSVADDGFKYFDNIIKYCRDNKVYVVFDLHAAPGFQNNDLHSDNPSSDMTSIKFWSDTNNIYTAGLIWKHIASRYVSDTVVAGWDLINEPKSDPPKVNLLRSYIKLTRAIRSVDPNHAIIAEGNYAGVYFQDMPKVWDKNVIYSIHHYPPQGDLQDLNGPNLFSDRMSLANNAGAPMYLGEYGENNLDVIRKMTDWVNDKGVSYTAWSFKKAASGNRELWSVNGTSGYWNVINWIRDGANGNPPQNAYNDMIDFVNQASNGGSGLGFRSDFYDAIKPLPNLVTTEVEHAESNNGQLIYPNPAQDYFELKNTTGIKSIEVLSISAVPILFLNTAQIQHGKIDISSLDKGIYIIKVLSFDNKVSVSRLVKQ